MKTEKPLAIADCETSPNYFALGIRELGGDRKERVFELSDRSTINWSQIDRIMRSYTMIGYNWLGFDKPLLRWCVENPDCTTEQIKGIANRIIGERMKWWESERKLDISIPRAWDSIDLIEPQPNPIASLKVCNGRMHGRWMQELPYAHDAILTHEQIDETNRYMMNDLDATELLWNALAEPMALREMMGETVSVDMRSKSDTQLGLAIIKARVEKKIGSRLPRTTGNRSHRFKYEAPCYLEFTTPILRDMMERLRTYEFQTDPKTGKADLPDFLTRPVTIGETTYAMGIGGLHSTESNRCVRADNQYALVDADVASYYPAIILSLGLYPEALGPVFLDVYRGIRDDRVAAKRAKNKAQDKGLKIALNGTFGSLGSPYSIVYAPHLLLAVTITGQLALLMMIETAERAGIQVVSANTDGVLFRCPREHFDGIEGDRLLGEGLLSQVTGSWEKRTQFDLEFVEYTAVYSQSVNSYFAIKANGGHKRKGPFANPWSEDPNDKDARASLMKNPQMTICGDAALFKIKYGTPVSETIRNCTDIRQFVTVVKATKGATWRDQYLGHVVRFYWGINGAPIFEAEPNNLGNHKTVSKTEGARPCMTLPDELPADIDYARYEEEAEQILKDLGFYGSPMPPVKMGRWNQAKVDRVLPWLRCA